MRLPSLFFLVPCTRRTHLIQSKHLWDRSSSRDSFSWDFTRGNEVHIEVRKVLTARDPSKRPLSSVIIIVDLDDFPLSFLTDR